MKKVERGFYPGPGVNDEIYNRGAEREGLSFRWNDRSDEGRPGTIEESEVVFLTKDAKARYTNPDGSLNLSFWRDARLPARPRKIIRQSIIDREIDGHQENNHREDTCTEFKNDPSEEQVCRQIVRASVDCDGNDNPGLVKCGDLHGRELYLKKMAKMGYSGEWISSTQPQAIALLWDGGSGQKISPYHRFWPRNIDPDVLDPFLQDSGRPNLKREYVLQASSLGIEIIFDIPFGTSLHDEVAFQVGGRQLFFGNRMIADYYEERRRLGFSDPDFKDYRLSYLCQNPMGAEKDPEKFPERREDIGPTRNACLELKKKGSLPESSPFDFRRHPLDTFFLHAPACPGMSPILADDDARINQYSYCGLYGVDRLNPNIGSLAAPYLLKLARGGADLEGLDHGCRIDAISYFGPKTVIKDLIRACRETASGPSTVVGEYYGALDVYSTGDALARFAQDRDPLKRAQIFDFGAKDAIREAFLDDENGSLQSLEGIFDVYEEMNFEPELLQPWFVDNHDDVLFADFWSGYKQRNPKKLVMPTISDWLSAYAFMGISQSDIYVYYAAEQLAHAAVMQNSFIGRAADMYARPKVTPKTDSNPDTWNIMERNIASMAEFGRRHPAISFGGWEGGFTGMFGRKYFVEDNAVAIKRYDGITGDMVMQIVLRGNGDTPPEDVLKDIEVNLPDGVWRDVRTNIIFDCKKGKLTPRAGCHVDPVYRREFDVTKEGRVVYRHQFWRNSVNDALYEIKGDYAKLPDGRYMAVSPNSQKAEDGRLVCDPRHVYRNGEYKDPYEGCAWVLVKGGKVLWPQEVSKGTASNFGVRKMQDERGRQYFTLPDGQYFYVNKEGAVTNDDRVYSETVRVRSGRIKIKPNTMVLYLEKA